ncbi:Nitrogen regulatory protein P-II [Methanosarcinaceae archaeon Ag5]|uniref:Nitrogen regulatory protein P-II n=1 Tax=Methanolapillus africanus TaxID=3028297 RepID=A0AAE4SFE1_9EURY|nr:Nitrogen regulatory protein P-II [Methanosarcinaceae archaeon Ag5]
MKMIVAVIRPDKFDAVKDALGEKGYFGMTVHNVCGRGEQRGVTLQYRGKPVHVDLIDKIEIQMTTCDEKADEVIDIIQTAAKSGKIGDGRIFVLPVEKAITIRTGEVFY